MAIKQDMLRHFVAVAETGSLAAGAARVGRSASAVSMMLKQFQDTLGAPLFASDRKTHLTPLGAFALDQARAEIAHFDRMAHAITRFAQTGGGLVRLACVPSVAAEVLPEAIRAFHTTHPNVQIDLRDMDSAAIVKGVGDGIFDVGIATAPNGVLRDSRDHLCDDPFGVICAPDHPLASRRDGVSYKDLHAFDVVMNSLAPTFDMPIARCNLTAHNTLSLLSMVQAGLGIAVLPKMVAGMAWKPICFIPLIDAGANRRIDLFWQQDSAVSAVTENLFHNIKSAL